MDNRILDKIKESRIIAVVRANSVEDAIEKGNALLKSGIRFLEITFTIPKAEMVIEHFSKNQMAIVGAGTVIDVEMAKRAIKAGAEFLISPGFDKEIGKYAKEQGIFYIPGSITPTDIMAAIKEDYQTVKLFPANTFGIGYMKNLKGPFPRLNFIPTGGLNKENASQWLEAGAIAIGVGGSLVNGSAEEIEKYAMELKGSIKHFLY